MNKQPGPSMTVVEDSRAKVSIMCACCSCVSCASRVSLSGNTGHRDCWVALCRVASLTCPHQVQGVPAEQSYGMGEMLGTMVVPPLWHIGARAMPTVLGAAGWALPPCPPAPLARANRSQPRSFAFQRSLAPAHLSTQASPCWVSAPTSARPMPTALGPRSVAGMAVAKSPV